MKGEKIAEAISLIFESAHDFSEIIGSMKAYLRKNNLRAYVLVDSLEDYHLASDAIQLAVQGFLKSLNEFTEPGGDVSARACIPAELYHTFKELSSNPTKDFDLQQVLHWHAGELLQICAARYAHYLGVKEPEIYQEIRGQYDLTKRTDVIEFWRRCTPQFITNGFGHREDPLAYILRHTQILPRQLLQYFNSIISLNFRKNKNRRDKLDEVAIIQGVQEIEGTMCEEIFSAFKFVHPNSKYVVERALPYLPYSFNFGELHRVYNRHVKAVFPHGDFDQFRSLLVEIGVVGRVERQTERYIIGRFEYTVPNRL